MKKILTILSLIVFCALSSCQNKDKKIMDFQTHFTMQDLQDFVYRMQKDESTKP